MQATAYKTVNWAGILAVAILAVALFTAPIEYAPAVLAAAAGLALFAAWCTMGRLIVAVCIWFVLVICFDEEFWRAEIPFFFNVTLSRLFIVVLGMMWLAMWALGRSRLRFPRPVLPLMIAILMYFTASAAITGFQSVAIASVHYRLIGGYWFAFAMFFFMLHAIRQERDIRLVLVFLFCLGLYLTFTGWCEYLEIWSLVFPRYIADSTVGIHWGRVRGPFVVSATMGVALTFCFFSNLLLARRVSEPLRMPVYLATLLMLPPIFWTQTRSVWLGFLIAAIVWILFNGRHWKRTASITVLAALALVVLVVNFENFSSRERSRGGVMDTDPIYLRIGLGMITWEMFTDRPLLGSGFGHFRDVAPGYARDVASPYYHFASPAMEHNSFFSILADTGLVGLGLYVGLLFVLLRISLGLYRKLPPTSGQTSGGRSPEVSVLTGRDLIVLYWALVAIYLVDAMFRETSVHPFTNSLFFGISGLMVALDWLWPGQAQTPAPSGTGALRFDTDSRPALHRPPSSGPPSTERTRPG